MKVTRCLPLALAMLLVACEGARQPPPVAELPPPLPVPEPAVELPQTLLLSPEEERYRRMIADWLLEGLRALREDRLMTPPERSAYNYFRRVLALEPENEVARDGLLDITLRYVQLADSAARQGQFDNARSFLGRAERITPDHDQIALGYDLLNREQARTHSVHPLEGRALREEEPALIEALHQLALLARDESLFVLITAPNDTQARWIYGQMQQALGEEHRLRGDIEIGSQPSVRLVLPPGAIR